MKDMIKTLQQFDFKQYWQPLIEQKWMPYYQSLAEREQRILLFAGIILPIILFVFVIILPLHDAQKSKGIALHVLQKKAHEAESLAAGLQDNGAVQARKASTMSVVDQIARKTQVRKFMTRLRPQMGNQGKQRLLIQMRNTPYKKTVVFFETLSGKGLSLIQVKFQQAKKQGFIHVQAVVE